jgi:hypothetical protein
MEDGACGAGAEDESAAFLQDGPVLACQALVIQQAGTALCPACTQAVYRLSA